MYLFSFLNNTVNTLRAGTSAAPQQTQPPAVMPPVAESHGASHASRNPDPNRSGSQNWTTQTPTGSATSGPAAARQTDASASAPQTSLTTTQGWAGHAAPYPDTGGVRFNFSQEAMDAAGVTVTPDSTATGQTSSASGETTGKPSVALPEQPASVTGKTMVRVEGSEDRMRAWAIATLQHERHAALPLSRITDATATPAPQTGSVTLNNANTELSARPTRSLEHG